MSPSSLWGKLIFFRLSPPTPSQPKRLSKHLKTLLSELNHKTGGFQLAYKLIDEVNLLIYFFLSVCRLNPKVSGRKNPEKGSERRFPEVGRGWSNCQCMNKGKNTNAKCKKCKNYQSWSHCKCIRNLGWFNLVLHCVLLLVTITPEWIHIEAQAIATA